MDRRISKGNKHPDFGDGAFERFLSATIAAILTIVFSWSLFQEMRIETVDVNDSKKRRYQYYQETLGVPEEPEVHVTDAGDVSCAKMLECEEASINANYGCQTDVYNNDYLINRKNTYLKVVDRTMERFQSPITTNVSVDNKEETCRSNDVCTLSRPFYSSTFPRSENILRNEVSNSDGTVSHNVSKFGSDGTVSHNVSKFGSDIVSITHNSVYSDENYCCHTISDSFRQPNSAMSIDNRTFNIYSVNNDENDLSVSPRVLNSKAELLCFSLLEPIIEEDSDNATSSITNSSLSTSCEPITTEHYQTISSLTSNIASFDNMVCEVVDNKSSHKIFIQDDGEYYEHKSATVAGSNDDTVRQHIVDTLYEKSELISSLEKKDLPFHGFELSSASTEVHPFTKSLSKPPKMTPKLSEIDNARLTTPTQVGALMLTSELPVWCDANGCYSPPGENIDFPCVQSHASFLRRVKSRNDLRNVGLLSKEEESYSVFDKYSSIVSDKTHLKHDKECIYSRCKSGNCNSSTLIDDSTLNLQPNDNRNSCRKKISSLYDEVDFDDDLTQCRDNRQLVVENLISKAKQFSGEQVGNLAFVFPTVVTSNQLFHLEVQSQESDLKLGRRLCNEFPIGECEAIQAYLAENTNVVVCNYNTSAPDDYKDCRCVDAKMKTMISCQTLECAPVFSCSKGFGNTALPRVAINPSLEPCSVLSGCERTEEALPKTVILELDEEPFVRRANRVKPSSPIVTTDNNFDVTQTGSAFKKSAVSLRYKQHGDSNESLNKSNCKETINIIVAESSSSNPVENKKRSIRHSFNGNCEPEVGRRDSLIPDEQQLTDVQVENYHSGMCKKSIMTESNLKSCVGRTKSSEGTDGEYTFYMNARDGTSNGRIQIISRDSTKTEVDFTLAGSVECIPVSHDRSENLHREVDDDQPRKAFLDTFFTELTEEPCVRRGHSLHGKFDNEKGCEKQHKNNSQTSPFCKTVELPDQHLSNDLPTHTPTIELRHYVSSNSSNQVEHCNDIHMTDTFTLQKSPSLCLHPKLALSMGSNFQHSLDKPEALCDVRMSFISYRSPTSITHSMLDEQMCKDFFSSSLGKDSSSANSTYLDTISDDGGLGKSARHLQTVSNISSCGVKVTRTDRKVFLVNDPIAPDFESFINSVPFTSEEVESSFNNSEESMPEEYSQFLQALRKPRSSVDFQGVSTISQSDVIPSQDTCILSGNIISPSKPDIFNFQNLSVSMPMTSMSCDPMKCEDALVLGADCKEIDGGNVNLTSEISCPVFNSRILDKSFQMDDSQGVDDVLSESTDFIFDGVTNSLEQYVAEESDTITSGSSDFLDEGFDGLVVHAVGVDSGIGRSVETEQYREAAIKDEAAAEFWHTSDSNDLKTVYQFPQIDERIRQVNNEGRCGKSEILTNSGVKRVSFDFSCMGDANEFNDVDSRDSFVDSAVHCHRERLDMEGAPDSDIKSAVGASSICHAGQQNATNHSTNTDRGLSDFGMKMDIDVNAEEKADPYMMLNYPDPQRHYEGGDMPLPDNGNTIEMQNVGFIGSNIVGSLSKSSTPVETMLSEVQFGNASSLSGIYNWMSLANPSISRDDSSGSKRIIASQKLWDETPVVYIPSESLLSIPDCREMSPQKIYSAPVCCTQHDARLKNNDILLHNQVRYNRSEDAPSISMKNRQTEEYKMNPRNICEHYKKDNDVELGSVSSLAEDAVTFSIQMEDFPNGQQSVSNDRNFGNINRPLNIQHSLITDLPGIKDHASGTLSDINCLVPVKNGDVMHVEEFHKEQMSSVSLHCEEKAKSLKELPTLQGVNNMPAFTRFISPDYIAYNRFKINASRNNFLQIAFFNRSVNSLSDQFALYKQNLCLTSAQRGRYFSPSKNRNVSGSIVNLSKKILKFPRQFESSEVKSRMDHLHKNCILTPEGRREILDKALSIDNLHLNLNSQMKQYRCNTLFAQSEIDTGIRGQIFSLPEHNFDFFDCFFPFRDALRRSVSMSEALISSPLDSDVMDENQYTGGCLTMPSSLPPAHASNNLGKSRFAHHGNHHQKSKSLCTLESDLDNVDADDNKPDGEMKRTPSVHELRVTNSLMKLNVPDWYKKSSLSKSSTSLLKYGSSSTLSSFSFISSTKLPKSPSPVVPTSIVLIKTRVVPSSNPRLIRYPAMPQGSVGNNLSASSVKLPSDALRDRPKNKKLMPIPIVPFSVIRSMFEKRTDTKSKSGSLSADKPQSISISQIASETVSKGEGNIAETVPVSGHHQKFPQHHSSRKGNQRLLNGQFAPVMEVSETGYSDDADPKEMSFEQSTLLTDKHGVVFCTCCADANGHPTSCTVSASTQHARKDCVMFSSHNTPVPSSKYAELNTAANIEEKNHISKHTLCEDWSDSNLHNTSEGNNVKRHNETDYKLDSSFSSHGGTYENEPKRLGMSTVSRHSASEKDHSSISHDDSHRNRLRLSESSRDDREADRRFLLSDSELRGKNFCDRPPSVSALGARTVQMHLGDNSLSSSRCRSRHLLPTTSYQSPQSCTQASVSLHHLARNIDSILESQQRTLEQGLSSHMPSSMKNGASDDLIQSPAQSMMSGHRVQDIKRLKQTAV